MIEIEQKWLEKFFFDPVMAAWVIMSAKLDTFQKARLRFYWFTPETIDSSGVGTGKTVVDFIYLNLRCILIPGHLAAIYFPNFQVGKDAFWNKYFPMFEELSDIFRAQFAQASKREEEKMNQRNPGAWIRSYKNGSKLYMPAPDFKGDSKNQASRDFNTVVVDDYLRAEDQGDGINKQLIDRARAPSFNKNHPIWCNHIKLLGHAGSPTHKGYQHIKAAKAMIRDGSSRNGVITFSYLDWSEELARKYREDNLIASQKKKLPADDFRRQYLGIWTIDGTDFYPHIAIQLARRREIIPQCGRRSPGEHFILGQDVAEPGSRHADFCAWVVYRIIELMNDQAAMATLERMGRYFHISAVFAHQLRNRDAGQIASLTHLLDLKFGGLSVVVLDPGGGGRWVLPELRKERQIIAGIERKVAPMTTRDDPLQIVRRPIVSFFGRGGGDFDSVIEEQWRGGEEGFIERSHQIFLDSWLGRHHHWPMEGAKRVAAEIGEWNVEKRYAQHFLDVAVKQIEAIRLLRRPDGSKLCSRRGYGMFEAKGKKDLGYAALYGRLGVELWLKDQEMIAFGEEGTCFAV